MSAEYYSLEQALDRLSIQRSDFHCLAQDKGILIYYDNGQHVYRVADIEALASELRSKVNGYPLDRSALSAYLNEITARSLNSVAPEYWSFVASLARLRLTEAEFKRLVSEGEIRAYRRGTEMVFRSTDVEALAVELGRVSQFGEDLYAPPADGNSTSAPDQRSVVLLDEFSLEVKRYLARHPEKLHDLTPRRFEELIAAIMKDFGFDVQLSQQTRDGGRDIYAYFRNTITSCLIFVECKKWAPPKNVGIDVVQRLHGVTHAHGANKGMIVTTSFFTAPARQERGRIRTLMDLRDYDDLKLWLNAYKQ